MTPTDSELVLCSRSGDLPLTWLPEAGALSLSESALCETLANLQPRWLPRAVAEQDPKHKQWIPYVLLRSQAGLLAAYPRQGAEDRLHGLWSIGLGGHINPVDVPRHDGTFPWCQTFRAGLQREIGEEYPAAAKGRTIFLGLIHENCTPVGQVHVGAVYLHEPEHVADPPGAELAGLRWIHPRDLTGPGIWPGSLELWSQLALRLLPS